MLQPWNTLIIICPQRRVVKKEQVSEEDWNSSRYWKQPVLNGPLIPNEYYLQRKCWDAEPNNVVKLSDWSVNETDRILTYYMDFCEYFVIVTDLWSPLTGR